MIINVNLDGIMISYFNTIKYSIPTEYIKNRYIIYNQEYDLNNIDKDIM